MGKGQAEAAQSGQGSRRATVQATGLWSRMHLVTLSLPVILLVVSVLSQPHSDAPSTNLMTLFF